MTRDTASDDTIATADEFEDALGDLLSAATASGIDLQGSWEYRSGDTDPDWEVMVYELEKRSGSG